MTDSGTEVAKHIIERDFSHRACVCFWTSIQRGFRVLNLLNLNVWEGTYFKFIDIKNGYKVW